jgi:hypothetical protein
MQLGLGHQFSVEAGDTANSNSQRRCFVYVHPRGGGGAISVDIDGDETITLVMGKIQQSFDVNVWDDGKFHSEPTNSLGFVCLKLPVTRTQWQ